ncbi:MAG: AI-2E family transporter [Candidatus Paceibacterota bacterium]
MRDRIQPHFLIAVLFGALVLSFFILQPFFAPLSLSIVFSVVLHPLYRRFALYFKGRNSLAALATVGVGIVLLLIPTLVLGSQLLKEAQQLYGSLSEDNGASMTRSFEYVAPIAERYVPGSAEKIVEFSASLDSYSQEALTWLIGHVGAAFSSLAAIFLDFFIFFVALYYLLRDGAGLQARLIELSPLNDRDDNAISDRLGLAVNSVVKGRLAIALIQGVLTGVGFALFGVPNPVLWGLIAVIASTVPPIGTALVVAPGVLFLLATGHMGAAIGLAIWGSVAVGSVDNILGPLLMSAGTQLHPLLVLLSLLGGIAFFGPVGIFLGPLTVSLLIVLLSMYTDLSKRNGAGESSVVQ